MTDTDAEAGQEVPPRVTRIYNTILLVVASKMMEGLDVALRDDLIPPDTSFALILFDDEQGVAPGEKRTCSVLAHCTRDGFRGVLDQVRACVEEMPEGKPFDATTH